MIPSCTGLQFDVTFLHHEWVKRIRLPHLYHVPAQLTVRPLAFMFPGARRLQSRIIIVQRSPGNENAKKICEFWGSSSVGVQNVCILKI